jgi:hypothetical protein
MNNPEIYEWILNRINGNTGGPIPAFRKILS